MFNFAFNLRLTKPFFLMFKMNPPPHASNWYHSIGGGLLFPYIPK